MKWIEALKEFNKSRKSWIVPKKGTKEHAKVMKIMNKCDTVDKKKKNKKGGYCGGEMDTEEEEESEEENEEVEDQDADESEEEAEVDIKQELKGKGMNYVKMTKKDFIKEHEKLIKLLDQLQKENMEQKAELKKVMKKR